jgi:hypothetical protein
MAMTINRFSGKKPANPRQAARLELEKELGDITEPHKPQFASAPGQARKAATVEDALAAAAELKGSASTARKKARERRAELSRYGKNALPPEQR